MCERGQVSEDTRELLNMIADMNGDTKRISQQRSKCRLPSPQAQRTFPALSLLFPPPSLARTRLRRLPCAVIPDMTLNMLNAGEPTPAAAAPASTAPPPKNVYSWQVCRPRVGLALALLAAADDRTRVCCPIAQDVHSLCLNLGRAIDAPLFTAPAPKAKVSDRAVPRPTWGRRRGRGTEVHLKAAELGDPCVCFCSPSLSPGMPLACF